jgi:hypothetical protein
MGQDNNHQSAQTADIADRMDESFAPNGATSNGAAGEATPNVSNADRAEQIADEFTARCAAVTSSCMRKVAWLTARAREVAEDMWAEAQSIRRKDEP